MSDGWLDPLVSSSTFNFSHNVLRRFNLAFSFSEKGFVSVDESIDKESESEGFFTTRRDKFPFPRAENFSNVFCLNFKSSFVVLFLESIEALLSMVILGVSVS